MKKLRTIESQEEVLAAIWSLDNYIPLSYLSEYPLDFYTEDPEPDYSALRKWNPKN